MSRKKKKNIIVQKQKLTGLGSLGKGFVKTDDKKEIFTMKPSDFDFKKKDSSSMIIVLKHVKSLSSELIDIQDKLVSLNREKYKKTIEELYNNKKNYVFL